MTSPSQLSIDAMALARSAMEEQAARIARLEEALRELVAVCGQASFALRELLPNDPDAQMTVQILKDALARSVLNKENGTSGAEGPDA